MRYYLKIRGSVPVIRYSLKIIRGLIRFSKGSEIGIFVNVFITADNFNYRSSDEGVMLLSS
jgi:hypothetical protein